MVREDSSTLGMATSSYTLPPLQPLDIHDPQAAEKWKKFKRAWTSYSLATGLVEKSEAVQVATLLTVIGGKCLPHLRIEQTREMMLK